jgi:hypothetical protein
MLIDQLKKQRSDGNSTCPLDPMDKTKFQWTFPGPLDPLDPLDTFVWLSQWPSIYMMSICLSLRHSNIYWLTNRKSKCPMDIPLVHWIEWTLSFGYLSGTVSTWGPWACHYVIQKHGNWPTEKANVRWKFHLSIGSNGQTKFQWTFPGPLDPTDTFVWLWKSIYMRSTGLSLRHSNTW